MLSIEWVREFTEVMSQGMVAKDNRGPSVAGHWHLGVTILR